MDNKIRIVRKMELTRIEEAQIDATIKYIEPYAETGFPKARGKKE